MTTIKQIYSSVSDSLTDRPVVSVVIPTYNRSDELPRAIDSVLSQTLSDLELIVVDDASTDDTEAVVSAYEDQRIRYVRHEANRGGGAARNTGIEKARGKYVAFLDSDDEWLPRKLERQVDCLESRSREWVAAYCGFERIRDGRFRAVRRLVSTVISPREIEGIEGGEELVDRSLLLDGFSTGGTSTLIVRRDVVESIDGFDETFERRQDWEFRNRLLRKGKLAFVDDVLLRKYESADPPPEAVERAVFRYLDVFSEDIRRLEREGHDVVGLHLFEVGRNYVAHGRFRRGTEFLRRSNINSARQCVELGYSLLLGLLGQVVAICHQLSTRNRPTA